MKVAKNLWHITAITKALFLFPGELHRFIKNASPQHIIRLKENLPLILWRWYYLNSAMDQGTTPYFYCQWRKERERWPSEGMFFPQSDILPLAKKEMSNPKAYIKIDVTVDYLAFAEQPFLVDFHNIILQKPLRYRLGTKYERDLSALNNLHGKRMTHTDANSLIDQYMLYCLFSWHHREPLFQKGFSFPEWVNFWKGIMYNINQNKQDGYGTDELIDMFVRTMRKRVPDYGLLSQELEKKTVSYHSKQMRQWGEFWVDFSYFFMLPFSWHLLLFAPFFESRANFIADVTDVLKQYHTEPYALYAPGSSIFPTTFGEKYFKDFHYAADHFQNN